MVAVVVVSVVDGVVVREEVTLVDGVLVMVVASQPAKTPETNESIASFMYPTAVAHSLLCTMKPL